MVVEQKILLLYANLQLKYRPNKFSFFGGVIQATVLCINIKYYGFSIGFILSQMKEEVKTFFKKHSSSTLNKN